MLFASVAVLPAQFKPPLTIDIPGYGFHYAGMRYNGAAELYEGTIIRLTDGGLFEAGSAFYPIPQEISSFTTDFDFYNTPTPGVGAGDGFAFVIQTRGSEALGGLGGDFGFLGGYFNQQEALGVTFSPGPPATTIRLFRSGDFTLSQVPEPSPDLRANNVNFYNGEYYSAHITYDGKVMVCTVSDVTGLHKASASQTFRGYPSSTGIPGDLDVPGILGSHYAYVGFSGGTGVNTASQHITGWTFRPGAPAAVPAPTFFPASGTKFQVPGPVTLTSPTPDSLIYYTLDGSPAGIFSNIYTGPIFANAASNTIHAIAVVGQEVSPTAIGSYAVSEPLAKPPTLPLNFAAGFRPGSVTLNGYAALDKAGNLNLTLGRFYGSGSAWAPDPLAITHFTTDFNMQSDPSQGDGMMFVLQDHDPHAQGRAGGDLGFGGLPGSSFGIKFDTGNTAGEGFNSTGVYRNGATPSQPSIDLTPTGLQLFSQDTFHVHMTNTDGTLEIPGQLVVTITDVNTGLSATQVYPSQVLPYTPSPSIYAGFTSGTGGSTSQQNIWGWTLNTDPPLVTPPPSFSTGTGTYSSPKTVSLESKQGFPDHSIVFNPIYYTLNGSTPTTNSTVFRAPISVTQSMTIRALAFGKEGASPVTAAYYTIVPPPVITN